MNIYVRNERRLKHYLLYVILMALPVFITKPAYSQWHQTAPQMDVPLTPKTVLVKGDTIFVGMYRGTIYRSTDAGKTWKPSNNGLSWDLYQTYDLLNISDTVFAATTDGVYVSTDFGSHWELRNNGLPYLYNLGINALTNFGKTVYAATPLNGVYKTNNGGKNWVPDNSGLPKNSQNSNENVPINDIIVTDSTIIAATAGIYHKKSLKPGGRNRMADLTGPIVWVRMTAISLQRMALARHRFITLRTTDKAGKWSAIVQ